jgi:hypothetical protein
MKTSEHLKNPLWATLPSQVRADIDALVMEGHKLQAVQLVRDALKEPRPGIYECFLCWGAWRAGYDPDRTAPTCASPELIVIARKP